MTKKRVKPSLTTQANKQAASAQVAPEEFARVDTRNADAAEEEKLSDAEKAQILTMINYFSVGQLLERYPKLEGRNTRLTTLFESHADKELLVKLFTQKCKQDRRGRGRYRNNYAGRRAISITQFCRAVCRIYDDAYCAGFSSALNGVNPKTVENHSASLARIYLPKSAPEKFCTRPINLLTLVMRFRAVDLFYGKKDTKKPRVNQLQYHSDNYNDE